jgi:small subunit ribosomal protein S13
MFIENKNSVFEELIKKFGVNKSKAIKLCIYIGTSAKTKYSCLSKKKKYRLVRVVNYYTRLKDSHAIGENLKVYYKDQIKRKLSNNCLGGRRYKLGLPIRGQRTSTNARTAKKLHRG